MAVLYTHSSLLDQIPNLLHAAVKPDSRSESEETLCVCIYSYKCSSPSSQQLTTDPYHDPCDSTPNRLSVYLYPILILSFHRCLALPSHKFRPIFTSQLCVRFSFLPHTCQCHLSYKNITTLNDCRASEEIKCDT